MGKIIKNHYFKLVVSSFLAGLVMALAGFELVAMKSENLSVLGAFLQGFGLMSVLSLNLYLFNSHICEIYFEKDKKQVIINQAIALLINAGTIIGIAYLLRIMSSNNAKLINAANEIAEARIISVKSFIGKEWYMSLIASIMCGIILGLAGYIYKKKINPILKVLTMFFAVGLYVICGFENTFTNLFYVSYANIWHLGTFLNAIIVLAGNFIGISLIYFTFYVVLLKDKEEKEEAK